MHFLIILFSTIVILWLFYWAIVRQSIIDSIQDDLENLKDRIAWNIINDSEGSKSKSAQRLMEEVNSNNFICWISFSQIVAHLFQNRAKIKSESVREMAIFESSPKWIRDAREINARLTIKAALTNSPVWWIPISIILLTAVFSKMAFDWWNDVKSSAIQLRSDHFGISQPV